MSKKKDGLTKNEIKFIPIFILPAIILSFINLITGKASTYSLIRSGLATSSLGLMLLVPNGLAYNRTKEKKYLLYFISGLFILLTGLFTIFSEFSNLK